jgi:hypothetical protein
MIGASAIRKREIAICAVKKFGLDLTGFTVLTEVASGNYMYTPIIAALAGAYVYAYGKDSRYGSMSELTSNLIAEAEELEVSELISVRGHKSRKMLHDSDIITNLGRLRPIGKEMIHAMKPTAVISLMYDPAEFRLTDLDLEECRKHEILVLGTNEESPQLDIMKYGGFLATKMLFEAGFEVYKDKIIVVGNGRLATNILDFMLCAKVNCELYSYSIAPSDLENADAIIVADIPCEQEMIGDHGLVKPKDIPKNTVVVHIFGKVNMRDIGRSGVLIFPADIAPSKSMTRTLDYLGPKGTMELNAAGLKVGEIMTRNRSKLDYAEALKASLRNWLVKGWE